jgi:RNA polymerase sigma-70 factor, ECF subfamily
MPLASKFTRPMAPSDEELVEQFQSGDSSAFDVLVRRWERKVQGAIYRLVGPGEDVRDLSQETLLKAYRGLRTFKKEARFSSWLYQIALNVCRDRMRRGRGKSYVSFDELSETGETGNQRGPSALDLIEARDLSRQVAAAVSALPDEQREVVVLKEYQGLTFLEIAEALDVPLSTVKTRLYRGLGQLRLELVRQGIRGGAPVPAPTS